MTPVTWGITAAITAVSVLFTAGWLIDRPAKGRHHHNHTTHRAHAAAWARAHTPTWVTLTATAVTHQVTELKWAAASPIRPRKLTATDTETLNWAIELNTPTGDDQAAAWTSVDAFKAIAP